MKHLLTSGLECHSRGLGKKALNVIEPAQTLDGLWWPLKLLVKLWPCTSQPWCNLRPQSGALKCTQQEVYEVLLFKCIRSVAYTCGVQRRGTLLVKVITMLLQGGGVCEAYLLHLFFHYPGYYMQNTQFSLLPSPK